MANGTQMTLEQLMPETSQKQIVGASDFHARLSRLLEIDEVSRIREALYSLKSCGWLKSDSLRYYSRKMLQDFLTMKGGVTFGVIINTMDELGYDVEWQVLDSQYFGVPQHRERVFIIGHLRGCRGRKVFPLEGKDGQDNSKGIEIIGTLDPSRHSQMDIYGIGGGDGDT